MASHFTGTFPASEARALSNLGLRIRTLMTSVHGRIHATAVGGLNTVVLQNKEFGDLLPVIVQNLQAEGYAVALPARFEDAPEMTITW